MLRLYNTALLPLRAVSALHAAWISRDPERALEWAERRATHVPCVEPGGIWIHGASVGEAKLVRQMTRALRARRPGLRLAASCTTPAGRAELPGPPLADAAFFMPLDFPGLPGRVLDAVRPAALALVETELWPNLLHEAWARSVPVVVINGRLAPERMPLYRRFRRLYRPLVGTLARVGAQTEDEARRFVEIGVPASRVTVTGNLKYDLPAPAVDRARLRARFGLLDRPVLVAGSTGEREEPVVLEAFVVLRKEHPRSFLVVAPRHVERADEVEREAASRGVRLHRLSRGDDHLAGAADGLLVDKLGELSGLYVLSAAAFVGGSLVPIGGHNVLEPAAARVPVLFGPHTHHVEEPAAALLRAAAALRVADGPELAEGWALLLRDPDRARGMAEAAASVVRANGGALERSVDLLFSIVAPATGATARKS